LVCCLSYAVRESPAPAGDREVAQYPPVQVGSEGDRFLVTPGDHHTLADRLFEFIEDESLRFRLGAAMRARIENLFDVERAAEICERATN